MDMDTLRLTLLLTTAVLAKPMIAPTMQEAMRSPLIVVARYCDYRTDAEGVSYFRGPQAHYRVEQVLKGKAPAQDLWVRYDFHDGSACLEPKEFRFSPNLMPAKNSRWLLFLKTDGKDWTTYRGDWGRQTADKAAEVRKRLP